MTSTPVSGDVSSAVLNLTSSSAPKERAENQFADVLNKQSQSSKTEEKQQTSSTARTKVERQGSGKVKEEPKAEQVTAETREKITDQVEDAAGELAEQLLEQLAGLLGISTGEAVEILEEMDMTTMDLLQTENLTQVFLTAAGEQDSLALLTNGELYGAMQQLTETLQTGLEQIAEITGQDVEDIRSMLEMAVTKQDGLTDMTQVPEEVQDLETKETEDQQTSEKEPTANVSEHPEENEGNRIMLERSQKEHTNQQDGGTHEENSGNNFFAQNLSGQQGTAALEYVNSAEEYFTADTQMIMDQIVEFMKVQTGDGLTQLEMQLHPESLGTLQIHIASKDGAITAQFTAQNEVVKAALETQMIQLKETFQEQGIKVDAIEVTVQSHGFERNLEQGRQDGQSGRQADQPRNRIRRLNLSGMEELSEDQISEEDRLTAEIMAQNGSTVDYTA